MSNPVVLMPGFTDTADDLANMANFVWRAGFHVHPFGPQPSDGSVPLEDLAAQLQAFIDLTFGLTQPVDLVAFSMGGLISRWYVQKLGGADRVQRLITLATPHNGTVFGYLPSYFPIVHLPGIAQMQPESAFLTALNQDTSALTRINFTSLWTPMDITVVPSASSVMEVGRSLRIPLPHHRALLTNDRAFAAVVQELNRPLDLPSQSAGVEPHA